MTPEERLELFEQLLDEIVSIIQEIVASGEDFSNELQNRVADELEFIVSEIERLRSEVGERGTSEIDQATINSIPSLDPGSFPSSNMSPEERLELFEQLLDEIVSIIQEIVASGEDFSNELQNRAADELEFIVSEIERLRSEIGERGNSEIDQATINSIPSLDPGPFPSSNVNSFKYNPENGDLFVKFHGKESADSGPIYKYDGIPKPIYDSFSKGSIPPKTSGKNRYHEWVKGVTPSLGASLYSLIKNGGYPYQRMS